MKKFLLASLFFLALYSCTTNVETYVVSNTIFSKTFTYSTDTPEKISVDFQQKDGDKTIANSANTPFFEFVIENELLTSNSKVWVFKGREKREMGNGGTEHRLVFEGAKKPVEGLQVVLFQQVFPQSTLMREKLELQADNKTFTLNKLNGDLHFKFPAYSVSNTGKQKVNATEIRMASFEKKPITFGNKKKGNHMYYPDVIESEVTANEHVHKGPITVISTDEISWFTAYEHASQDDLRGMFDEQKLGEGNLVNDATQGIKGVFDFPIVEEDFKFLGISTTKTEDEVAISVDALRGAYLDGEKIDAEHPYSSVWTATGFYSGNNLEDGKMMLRNYLFNQICEKRASRVPEYYYNTWGMQRNDRTKPLRGILIYERIFEEIEYAAELGVDIFVLDDGWQVTQGIWYPNEERLTEGLAPIKKKLDEHGLKMGLWYSPMGIDSTTQRYKDHQNWVVKDSEGNPILAQWNHPAFDFVSGFFDVFVADCKNMIDQGCRFMKWDAINTFYSTLPNLQHGTDEYSEEEIRARYEYLLPIYVTRAMEILTDYEPELIIEMDLTEARRVMVGLAPLSQGKLFWMNNGASWYNDYTTFRTQSMRTIANEFAGLIPLELFTYANYPHNLSGNMKYNVHNSLLCGHGFWGNLELMQSDERKWIGKQVAQSKKVLPYLVDVNPEVKGLVGDSPEIYSIVNSSEAAGQVIVFSSEPVSTIIETELNPKKMLVALNTKYNLKDNNLITRVEFTEKEGSKAILILPNQDSGVSIIASDSEIESAAFKQGMLEYKVTSAGTQTLLWNKKLGKPKAAKSGTYSISVIEKDDAFEISVVVKEANSIVKILA